MCINGALAGLVAITAPCAFVSIESSLIIGAVAGVLVVVAVMFFDRKKLDDPVGAISVHLVNGIFGTIAVGLDIGEHGNSAYPEFLSRKAMFSVSEPIIELSTGVSNKEVVR